MLYEFILPIEGKKDELKGMTWGYCFQEIEVGVKTEILQAYLHNYSCVVASFL